MTEATLTRIKICGITRLEDAEGAAAAGVDALGLNFVASSPRAVSIETARIISRQIGSRVLRVALFADPQPAAVEAVLSEVDIDVLQFHGSEPASLCGAFGLPYMKAVRVSGPLDITAIEAAFPDACALLLDTFVAGQAGGTGRVFDWSLWPAHARLPLVLAGGLTADNVVAAITRTRPFAVDLSGGVEGNVKGQKDAGRIGRFVAAVREADGILQSRSRPADI